MADGTPCRARARRALVHDPAPVPAGRVATAILDTSAEIEDPLGRNRAFRSKQAEIEWLRGSVTQLQSERDELYGIGSSEHARGRKEALAERQAEFEAALDEYVRMEGRTTDRLQAETGPWLDDLYRRLNARWPDAHETRQYLTARAEALEPDLRAIDTMAAAARSPEYPDRAAQVARVYEVFGPIHLGMRTLFGQMLLDLLRLAHHYGIGAHDAARLVHEGSLEMHWSLGAFGQPRPLAEGERPQRMAFGVPTCHQCGATAVLVTDGYLGRDYCAEHAPRCATCNTTEGVAMRYAPFSPDGKAALRQTGFSCPQHIPGGTPEGEEAADAAPETP